MPSFLKTPEDERLWQRAKEQAAEAGHAEDWPYVTGIWKRMKGKKAWGQQRERSGLVDCPVCGKRHPLEPKGDELRWHRIMLMRAPREAVERWNQIRKRATMSTDLRSAAIRLAHSQPKGSEFRRKLLATVWQSAPTAEDFKSDPKAGKLYGQYVFWLLHHDGSPRQKGEAKKAERALSAMGFNQWGLAVDNWPDAAREYIKLTRQFGIEPEAVRAAALRFRRAYETGETEPDGWNPGTVTPSSWPAGEGSQMPPARDLQGLQLDGTEFSDNHFAKGASLRARAIKLASTLPQGSEARRKLLAVLKSA